MSTDLRAQLAEYGRYHREEQRPVDLDEIVPVGDLVRPAGVEVTPTPRRWRRGLTVAVAAAVFIVVLVGAVGWLALTSAPEPAEAPTTTVPQDESLGVQGVLGPGAWSVAATLGDASIDELTEAAEQLQTWPGVIEVALVPDEAAWRELTGLETECSEADRSPPCAPGVVALTGAAWMVETAERARAELGMDAIAALDVPQDFVEGYFAAVVGRASPAPLDFDAAALGEEVPLLGPFVDLSGEQCGVRCDIVVEVDANSDVYRAGIELDSDPEHTVVILGVALAGGGRREQLEVAEGGGGYGLELQDLLVGVDGSRGVLADLESVAGGRRIYALAGLPVEAAAVTIEGGDGNVFWQRPRGGMVLFVAPGAGDVASPVMLSIFNSAGVEIMRIEEAGFAEAAVDLRVAAAELPATGLPPPQTAVTLAPDFDEEDSTEPPMLDASAPIVASEGEVVSTPSTLGDITWRVFDFDGAGAPTGPYVAVPGGFAAVDRRWDQSAVAWRSSLWMSPDGIEWLAVPSPVPGIVVHVEHTSDGYLLETTASEGSFRAWVSGSTSSRRRWASADFASWVEVEPYAAVVPDVSGTAVHAGANVMESITVGAATLSMWERYLWVDWRAVAKLVLGELPGPTTGTQDVIRALWSPANGTLDIVQFGSDRDAFDRVEGTVIVRLDLVITGSAEEWEVELADAATGQPVGTITGSMPVDSLNEIPALLADGLRAWAYTVTDGEEARLVQPEWLGVALQSDDGPMLSAGGDAFVAHIRIGHTGVPGDNRVWTSADGLDWEQVSAPPWPDTSEVLRCCPAFRNGVGIVQVTDGREHPAFEIFRSEDGATWRSPSEPPDSMWDEPVRVFTGDGGWVAIGVSSNSPHPLGVWTSSDGDVWEPVAQQLPAPELGFGFEAESVSFGNGFIFYVSEAGTQLVIGQIDPG